MIFVKKLLYMFGVLVALVAVLTAGAIGFAGAQHGAWTSVVVAGAVACAGVAFIWFAHGRTNALEAERRERERSDAAAVLDAALARHVASSRFAARRNLLWLAGATLLVAIFAGGAVLMWSAGAYGLTALVASVAGILLWFLVPALASREAIVVDVRGIELPGLYHLIPWNAIHEALLSSYEHRGTRVAEARLGVKDAARYRRSRWGLSLGMHSGDQVVVPLRGLDQTPETIFAAIRQSHERAAPKGTLTGGGGYYRVDPGAARLEVIHKRMLEIGEEMKGVAADLDRRAPVADASPGMKAFERASESRLKEMEALGAESSRLLAEQTREFESRMARARRSLTRLRWLAYAALALAVLIVAFKILAR
jgi:hypothetical protein